MLSTTAPNSTAAPRAATASAASAASSQRLRSKCTRPRAHEQADPGVENGIGGEPEPVRHGRRGDRRVQEEERVVEVAGGPEQQRDSEAAPGCPLGSPLLGGDQAGERRADEQDVVEPPDDVRRSGRLHHEQDEIDREEGGKADEEPPAAGSRHGWVCSWCQRLHLGSASRSEILARGISSRSAGIRPPVRVIASRRAPAGQAGPDSSGIPRCA